MLPMKVECSQPKDKMKSEPNSSLSFPLKLYTLLDNEDGDVVKWVPHGFAFIITNQEKLVYDILPKYFKHTKLTSFQRQLNLYGFRRLTKGDDQGAYFHPKFQRNRKDLAYELHRLPPKGSLATIDQVINANRLLPSERYGNTNKASIKNNNSESYNDKYHSTKAVAPPPQQQQQQQQTFSSSKITTTRPTTSSVVVTSRPLTKSKVTMNLGFNMKQYSKDPSTSSSISSNGGCTYNPPVNHHHNNNNDNKKNCEEATITSTVVDFDTLNNSMMMMSSCNSSNNPWSNELNFGRSSSLNDVIELLHPTSDDNYDDDHNNDTDNPNNSPGRNSSSRNSKCHDNCDHTDNDNYQSQQVYDRTNYDPDNYLGVFELDDDDLNNFFYNDTGVDS